MENPQELPAQVPAAAAAPVNYTTRNGSSLPMEWRMEILSRSSWLGPQEVYN